MLSAATAFAQASAESRFALVVGNGAYKSGALPALAVDAKAMAETLRGFGFKVIELIDGNLAKPEKLPDPINDLTAAASG